MAKEIRLPQLGQTMEEGTIVNYLVADGDKVEKGDVIAEVETDKATLEIESPAAGFVKKILVKVDQTIPVNTAFLVLGDEDEEVSQSFIDSLGGAAPQQAVAAEPVVTEGPAATEAATPTEPVEVEPCPSAKVVRLPQLGQTMEEGTIVNYLVSEGDEVSRGEVILEVETDKATLEVESPAAGFVKKILVEVDQTIAVNSPVMILADKDAEVSDGFIASVTSGGAAKPAGQTTAKAAVDTAAAPKPVTGKVIASPRAKMIAKELGVDLATVRAAAGSVRITEADVRSAASGATSIAAPAGRKVPLNKLQRITGKKMLQSKREIPCFYLNDKVDMTDLVELRTKMNAAGSVKVSYNDFIMRAVAMGLVEFPIMTGQLAGDCIRLADGIHIGLAISVDDGLISPLIRDADKKNVTEIAAYGKELIARTKANKITLDDLEGGCITVSNLGAFGIHSFIPIVVPGQCSILGIGAITDTCVPVSGEILVRKMMNMNLAVDHRVANGADAAQFLDLVKKHLENPSVFQEEIN